MRVPLDTLKELMDYHYERRDWLYRFLASITPEEFVRPMNVGWESIRTTLMHCLFAEDFWLQHRLQQKERPSFNPAQYTDLPSVVREADAVRSRSLDFLQGLTDEALIQERSFTYSGNTFRYTVGKAFMHVITHDVHHRGQVVALARQLGHEPPELDML